MKKERDQACRNYEIRVNMLGSGQYQEDEVDPYYQEKFEFAVDHKFSSDEEESCRHAVAESAAASRRCTAWLSMSWRMAASAVPSAVTTSAWRIKMT